MHEHTSVFLIEVFYGLRFGVELYGAGDRGREFLVRKIDARKLGIEGACDEGAEEGIVAIVFVERAGRRGIWRWDKGEFAERGEVLGAVGGDVGEGLVGKEVGGAPGADLALADAGLILGWS